MAADDRPIPSDTALADVRERFARRHADGAAPSTVYGVLAGGRVVDSFGFGDIDGHGTTPTRDTAYRLASMTKSFTAATLLVLRDRGALTLDAPITDLVPAFTHVRLPTADSPVPTLRMLATMSAGLPNDDPWADRQEALADDELDAVLRAGVRFAFVPGTEFEYSNLGYALLGRAIQVAGGRRFNDLVTDEILRPLGLGSTAFTADVPAAGGVAIGHERIDGAWSPMPFSGPGAFSAIGGLFSTIDDIAAWMQWFIDAARGDLGGPLSAASRREMQQAQRLIPADNEMAHGMSAGYGLGLVRVHDPDHGPIVSHSGGYPGFSSHMRWHSGSGLGIVAFENATYAGVAQPATAALRSLLASLGSRPVAPQWPETVAAQPMVTALIDSWDDEVAARLFSSNVAMDVSFDRRRAAIADAVASSGRLGETTDEVGELPNERAWRIRGERADLRCEITMSPHDPPLVQTLDITVEEHAVEAADAPAGPVDEPSGIASLGADATA